MYLDIFFNCASSRQERALEAMKRLDRSWELFFPHERRWMHALIILYTMRLHRISALARRLSLRVRSIEPKPQGTLNRIVYRPGIQQQLNTAS
jgi:hypothetical protein